MTFLHSSSCVEDTILAAGRNAFRQNKRGRMTRLILTKEALRVPSKERSECGGRGARYVENKDQYVLNLLIIKLLSALVRTLARTYVCARIFFDARVPIERAHASYSRTRSYCCQTLHPFSRT